MSKATWEEEIEDKLHEILTEIKTTQEMVGNCMGMPDVKIPPKETPTKKTQTPDGETMYKNIGELKDGDKNFNIKGTVPYDPVQRDVNTSEGPKTVTNLVIGDETGEIRIAFWEELGNEAMDLVKGDTVVIEKIYRMKAPWDGMAQADAGKYFKMAKLN